MSKNIVFYDLETTGKSQNPNDVRIIEISAIKVNPDTLDIVDKIYYKCSNGAVKIDPDATERHGMTEADLVGCPTFQEVAGEVYEFFEGCDVGGYYCTVFDIPILYYSFVRAGYTWDYKNVKNFDIYTLFRKFYSGKLGDVYKRYTGKDLEDAHSADADVMATIEVYKQMREKEGDFDDEDLDTFSDRLDMVGNFRVRALEDGKKEIYIAFGKWKGTSVDKVDISYLKWMFEKGGFAADTTYYAKKIYDMRNK